MDNQTLVGKNSLSNYIDFDIVELLPQIIYEVIDAKPIFYRGFENVLKGLQKIEDMRGSSSIQVLLVSIILKHLYRNLDDDDYAIFTNEVGLHLSKKNNLSCDIVIYDKKVAQQISFNEKYTTEIPQIVIEVDTEADVSSFINPIDYYFQKTQKLLDFGVQKVIWFLSDTKKVTIAENTKPWLTLDWEKEIEILKDCKLSLGQLIEESNFQI